MSEVPLYPDTKTKIDRTNKTINKNLRSLARLHGSLNDRHDRIHKLNMIREIVGNLIKYEDRLKRLVYQEVIDQGEQLHEDRLKRLLDE